MGRKQWFAVGLVIFAGLAMGVHEHFIYTEFLDVSAQGRDPAFRISTEVNSSSLVVYEKKAEVGPLVRGKMALDDDGLVSFQMNDGDSKLRIRFAVEKNGEAAIQILGRDGKPVWGVSVDENDTVTMQ